MKQARLIWCLTALLALSSVACSDSDTDADIGSGTLAPDGGEDSASDSVAPSDDAALKDTTPRQDVALEDTAPRQDAPLEDTTPRQDVALDDAASDQEAKSDAQDVDDKDLCPKDPHKTAPGKCGCGTPDTRVCGKLLRQDLQDAIVHTMWAYYLKGAIGQYDSYTLLKYKAVPMVQGSQVVQYPVWVDHGQGANSRITTEVAPEYGTSDTTIFSVCSSYPYMSMFNSILHKGKPYQFNAERGPKAPYYGYRYTSTREMWRVTSNDAVIMRWSRINFEDENKAAYRDDLKERKYSSEADYPTTKGWKNERSYLEFKNFTPEKMQQWWSSGKWENFLQPGDIIVYLRKTTGHAIEYIGNGMVVESSGQTYTVTGGPDEVTNIYNHKFSDEKYESDGTFNLYSIKDYFCKEKSAYNAAKKEDNGSYRFSEIIIIRPINLMLNEGKNGQLTDEVKPEYSIVPSALSRIRYPGMEIDRTVSLTPYGTAYKNEPVTYRIRITNHTRSTYQGLHEESSKLLNEENVNHSISFAAWLKKWAEARGESVPTDYNGVVVRDVIPDGTRLLNPNSYDFDPLTGAIRWKLNIKAGETAVLSYSVVLKDDHGDYITSEGGTVDAIPMNTLKNRTGRGKRVTKAQLQDYLRLNSTSGRFSNEYEFVKDVFNNLLKAGSFKYSYEIVTKDLFDRYNYKRTTWPSLMDSRVRAVLESNSLKVDYFILKGTFDNNFKIVDGSFRDYLVEGFIGGRRVWTPDNTLRALELRSKYFMPGDIFVRASLDTDGDDHEGRKAKWTKTLVYMGDDTYIYYDFNNKKLKTATFKDTPNELWDAFTKDYFFVLRTSQ